MARFASIKDDKVNNVIVADTKEIAEAVTGLTCIEVSDDIRVEIGGIYDGTIFHPAIPEVGTEEPKKELPQITEELAVEEPTDDQGA